jgi:ureidoacrylate peracid hydrolase
MSTQDARRAGAKVQIPAKPEPLIIDTARTAVLVVDMQNDFAAPGGMFDRAGADIAMIRRVIAPIREVLLAARKAEIPVIYLTMAYRPDLSDAGAADDPNRIKHELFGVGTTVIAPNGQQGRILVNGTWNTAIVDELAPQRGDRVISKHRFSGFFETDLAETLTGLGARYLVVTGCTTSVCVESTIRDAMFRGYSCVLLADCAAEPLGSEFPRSNHDASLLVIERLFGWVANSGDFVGAIAGESS